MKALSISMQRDSKSKPNINFQRTIRRLPDSEELDNLLNNSELNNLMRYSCRDNARTN